MTTQSFPKIGRRPTTLSAPAALRIARVVWSVLFITPYSIAIWISSHISPDRIPLSRLAEGRWFVISMLYVVLIAPAAFFCHEYIYKNRDKREAIRPANYLFCLIATWVALLSSGILSLTGCLVVGSLIPNIIPAFFAMMLFLMLFPTRRSIGRRRGKSGVS